MMRTHSSFTTHWPSVALLFLFTLVGWSGAPLVAPAVAGDDPPYAAKLRKLLLQQLRDNRVPGALVYVDHPQLGTWSTTLGSSNLTGAPLDIASHMRIGSVTKTLTATAVLQLVDMGLVDLDEPIDAYLPGVVPNGGAITVRQLLNMTAGLFNNTEDLSLNEALDADPLQVFTP
jgi:D-alanyl-D-alanine carboxypeptidase